MKEKISNQEALSRIGEKIKLILDHKDTSQEIYGIAWEANEIVLNQMSSNYDDECRKNNMPDPILDTIRNLPDDVCQTINPDDYPDGDFPF